MPIELATTALAKLITPLLTSIAKEGIDMVKGYSEKQNAERAINSFSRTLKSITTVRTIWSRDEGIPIDQFYYPPKISRRNNPEELEEIDEIANGRVLVEGIVGQGKSILLRHLCSQTLERGLLPVFIELRMLSKERKLKDLILNFLDSSGLLGTPEFFNHLAKNNKISLILDGFDEIPSEIVTDTIYEIEQLQRRHEDLSIIISSRPHHAAHNLADFKIYALQDFDEDDHEPFLRKIIPDTVKRFNITEAIKDAEQNIKGVITTPLMLTLLVLVYESESEIPTTLPDFFDKLFNTVFSKHDRLKAGFNRKHYSNLPESKIQKLFDAFCFMHMQAGGNRNFDKREFSESFERAIKYTPESKCDIDNFRKDMVTVSCLMLEDGFEQLTFLHKSIMEYHAASFIKNSSNEFAERFYHHAPEHYALWAPVLTFLSSIDSYKYGRFYILKEYPNELEDISEALKDESQHSLITYLNKKYINLKILTSNFKIRSMQHTRGRAHSFTREISTRMHMNMCLTDSRCGYKSYAKSD